MSDNNLTTSGGVMVDELYNKLRTENEQLRQRVKELEDGPPLTFTTFEEMWEQCEKTPTYWKEHCVLLKQRVKELEAELERAKHDRNKEHVVTAQKYEATIQQLTDKVKELEQDQAFQVDQNCCQAFELGKANESIQQLTAMLEKCAHHYNVTTGWAEWTDKALRMVCDSECPRCAFEAWKKGETK